MGLACIEPKRPIVSPVFLVNGSFVFVEHGHQSRDKFMSSGQNIAIKGTTMGYYLFKRCEANRQ